MRFPRGYGFDSITVNPKTRVPEYYFGEVDSSSNLFAIDISLLEKLVLFSRDVNTAKVIDILK